jgi:hypothetical protein
MKRTQKTSALLAIIMMLSGLAVLVTPASLSAYTSMNFIENGVGNFNEFSAISADPIFAAPGFMDFRDAANNPVADWSGFFVSAYSVGASGGTRDLLRCVQTFEDAYALTAFSFDFRSFEDDILRDWVTVSYNGNGISDGANWSFAGHPIDTVPEPSTLLLIGGGLAGLVGFVRRSRS